MGTTTQHETSAPQSKVCRYCGVYVWDVHPPERCPRIQAIEYHPDGSIKRVEFR